MFRSSPSERENTYWVAISFAAFISASLSADVLTVDDDGPADFFRIQDAIDAAVDGDEILVAPGRYIRPEDFNGDYDEQVVDLAGKAIRLRSSDGPEVTIIDGRGVQRCVSCRSGEELTTEIIGFTLKNGYSEMGGAGLMNAWSSPTVINCIFENNNGAQGGAILNAYSDAFIFDCTFIGNSAQEEGGAIFSFDSVAQIINCSFSGNSSIFGGAMFMQSTAFDAPTITDCTFEQNEAASGGAIHALASKYLLVGCTFITNSSNYGGALAHTTSDPTITRCTFIANSATNGGACFNELKSIPLVTESEFQNNLASLSGPAIHNESGSIVGLSATLFCGHEDEPIFGPWEDYGKNIFLNQCEADPDIDGNGIIDGNDLNILLGMWGPCNNDAGPCSADLDGNDIVDGADLNILLANWTSK